MAQRKENRNIMRLIDGMRRGHIAAGDRLIDMENRDYLIRRTPGRSAALGRARLREAYSDPRLSKYNANKMHALTKLEIIQKRLKKQISVTTDPSDKRDLQRKLEEIEDRINDFWVADEEGYDLPNNIREARTAAAGATHAKDAMLLRRWS